MRCYSVVWVLPLLFMRDILSDLAKELLSKKYWKIWLSNVYFYSQIPIPSLSFKIPVVLPTKLITTLV